MGIIPEITCRRCGNKYPGTRSRCPKCGAPRTNQPVRVPPTTASVTPETAASERNVVNIRWQLIFGAVLVLAVILAIVVLILTGGNKGVATTPGSSVNVNPNPSVGQTTLTTDASLPTPSPSPEPTPEAEPTPLVESLQLTFLNQPIKEAEVTITREGELTMDLDCIPYPNNDSLVITWTSSDENVLTVDQTGLITIVGANPEAPWAFAEISASCGGQTAKLLVRVPSYQAAYLTRNLYLEAKANATTEPTSTPETSAEPAATP